MSGPLVLRPYQERFCAWSNVSILLKNSGREGATNTDPALTNNERTRFDMAKPPLKRTRVCPQCGTSFSYVCERGRDRKYCGRTCAAAASMATFKRKHGHKTCSVEACNNKLKNTRTGHCSKHEARFRRTGDTKKIEKDRRTDDRGYVSVRVGLEHPLSDRQGWTYEHRLVAYSKYGPEAHFCHWCGTSITWANNVVDHLDEVKANNDPDNLVSCCSRCNLARGAMLPFLQRMTNSGYEDFIKALPIMRRAIPNKAQREGLLL